MWFFLYGGADSSVDVGRCGRYGGADSSVYQCVCGFSCMVVLTPVWTRLASLTASIKTCQGGSGQ
jgi:hypothetical protein